MRGPFVSLVLATVALVSISCHRESAGGVAAESPVLTAGSARVAKVSEASPASPSAAVAAPPPVIKPSSTVVTPVGPGAFCPTSATVTPTGASSFKVNAGGMRGVVGRDSSKVAELAFTFRGPSSTTAPLADGTLRRQMGLRLRAKDTCNAVYIMWQVAPNPQISVSVKRNAGQSRHAQCLDRGYINLKATSGTQPAPVVPGARRVMRAELNGTALRVFADGVLAWEGTLPAEALSFDGPAGIRSDNGEFDFELRVPGGAKGANCSAVVRD